MSKAAMKPKKYAYIDALRGVAATGIIVHHVPRAYLSEKVNAFLLMGAGGVPLFFMLSAFTLFLSYHNRKNDDEKHPTLYFYIRRFFRIAPLFYALMIFFLCLEGFGLRNPDDPASAISILTVLSTITFTFGLHPYWISSIVHNGWSIGTEMLFYLVVPLLYPRIKNIGQALWFLVFGILFAKVVVFTVAHTLSGFISPKLTATLWWNAYLYQFFPSQVPIFALGILLFFLVAAYQNAKTSSQLSAETTNVSWPILALFVLLFVNSPLKRFYTDGLVPSFVTEYALLYMPFIFALYLNPIKLVVNSVTIYLGKISYSLYLTHAIAILFLEHVLPPFVLGHGIVNYLLFLFLTLGLTVIIATVTYHLIEKPGQELGRKLIARMEENKVIPSTPELIS